MKWEVFSSRVKLSCAKCFFARISSDDHLFSSFSKNCKWLKYFFLFTELMPLRAQALYIWKYQTNKIQHFMNIFMFQVRFWPFKKIVLFASIFICFPYKNDKNVLLFYLKSTFRSQDVKMFCNDQCFNHIETSQLICFANQLTGFYMMRTLIVKS